MTCLYEASGDGFEQSAFRFWTNFRAVFALCILFRTDCLSCVDQAWRSVTPPKLPQSKEKVCPTFSYHIFLNNSCHCSQDIKQPLRDERIFQTKARQNKTKLNDEEEGEKKNVWDFKLRKIKMQDVSFIEFAVTLCLRTQIPLMAATPCVKSLFISTTTSSIKLHKFLCFPQTDQ